MNINDLKKLNLVLRLNGYKLKNIINGGISGEWDSVVTSKISKQEYYFNSVHISLKSILSYIKEDHII